AIQADKDLLCQVFRIASRSRKPVANVVDTPILLADKLLPGACIASNAAPNQSRCERILFQPLLASSTWALDHSHSRLRNWRDHHRVTQCGRRRSGQQSMTYELMRRRQLRGTSASYQAGRNPSRAPTLTRLG